MAGNYTYFSFQVQLDNYEQAEWIRTFLKYAENVVLDTVALEDGPQSEELLEVFPEWNELEVLGFDWEVNGKEIDGLWIYTEVGEGNTTAVADFLQHFLRKFQRKDAVGFEFCCKSGAMRLNEFYGGACVVSAHSQEWNELGNWVRSKVREMNR